MMTNTVSMINSLLVRYSKHIQMSTLNKACGLKLVLPSLKKPPIAVRKLTVTNSESKALTGYSPHSSLNDVILFWKKKDKSGTCPKPKQPCPSKPTTCPPPKPPCCTPPPCPPPPCPPPKPPCCPPPPCPPPSCPPPKPPRCPPPPCPPPPCPPPKPPCCPPPPCPPPPCPPPKPPCCPPPPCPPPPCPPPKPPCCPPPPCPPPPCPPPKPPCQSSQPCPAQLPRCPPKPCPKQPCPPPCSPPHNKKKTCPSVPPVCAPSKKDCSSASKVQLLSCDNKLSIPCPVNISISTRGISLSDGAVEKLPAFCPGLANDKLSGRKCVPHCDGKSCPLPKCPH